MSSSSPFSCCDCYFGTNKTLKSPELQGQGVALLPKVNTICPEKVFEFQQVRQRKVSGEEEDMMD